MAIKIFEKYGPRANPADADYPYGSIKNESVPGANDGTPLEAAWANDYAGTDAALFAAAGIVPNGQPDTVGNSQRVEAIKSIAPDGGVTLGEVDDIERTIKSKLSDVVSVFDFMSAAQILDVKSGLASVDVTAALASAIASKRDLFFPSGVYRVSSTLTGIGAWIGSGQGVSAYGSTYDKNGTYIKLVGTNGGAYFLNPPKDFIGFHIFGEDKTQKAVALGENGSFTAFQRWSRLTVRGCADAIEMYNFYSTALTDIVMQGNSRGLTISPTDTVADDGYFTATTWRNIHVADNDVYGLNIAPPLVSGTLTIDDLVVERNGLVGGSYQAFIKNTSLNIRGGYFEGSSSIPALKTQSSAIIGDEFFFNGTGGIDGSASQAILNLKRVRMTGVNDLILNFASTSRVYLENSDIQTDLRTASFFASLRDVSIAGVATKEANRQKTLSVGQSPSASSNPSEITLTYAGKKTVTATIPANSSLEIVNNSPFGSITSDAVGIGQVQGYYPGLIAQVTPATTGSTDYYCVRLINTTAASISLTSVQVNWFIFRFNAYQL